MIVDKTLRKFSSQQWARTHSTINIHGRNYTLNLRKGAIFIWESNDSNSQNKWWNIRKRLTFTFAAQLYLYGKNYTYKLFQFLKKPLNDNTENGKVHNSQSTKCQVIQSRSLLHFAYHNIKTANSLLPVHLTINRLSHFQVSSQHLHHRTVNDWYLSQFNLIPFKML